MIQSAMKNTKRLLLGFLSSVLLAIGFARAAETIDPITLSCGIETQSANFASIPGTTGECDIA